MTTVVRRDYAEVATTEQSGDEARRAGVRDVGRPSASALFGLTHGIIDQRRSSHVREDPGRLGWVEWLDQGAQRRDSARNPAEGGAARSIGGGRVAALRRDGGRGPGGKQRANDYFWLVQREARERAKQAGVVLHVATLAGHAAQRLVEYATTEQVELLVLGHSGHTGIWGQFLGTTADKVVRHAPCSVLVVR